MAAAWVVPTVLELTSGTLYGAVNELDVRLSYHDHGN